MDSRCKPHRNLLRNKVQANLLASFLTGIPVQLASTPVPRQLPLERERTPGTPRCDRLGPQPQQQQIRHEGHSHRVLHPRCLLGDLVLPQPDDPFQFLDTEFYRPSSEVDCDGYVSSGLRQIGHEQFGVFGALVTPPPTVMLQIRSFPV
jgi:hypothetical protein